MNIQPEIVIRKKDSAAASKEKEIGNKFSCPGSWIGTGPRLNGRVQVTRGPRLEISISKFQFVPNYRMYLFYILSSISLIYQMYFLQIVIVFL